MPRTTIYQHNFQRGRIAYRLEMTPAEVDELTAPTYTPFEPGAIMKVGPLVGGWENQAYGLRPGDALTVEVCMSRMDTDTREYVLSPRGVIRDAAYMNATYPGPAYWHFNQSGHTYGENVWVLKTDHGRNDGTWDVLFIGCQRFNPQAKGTYKNGNVYKSLELIDIFKVVLERYGRANVADVFRNSYTGSFVSNDVYSKFQKMIGWMHKTNATPEKQHLLVDRSEQRGAFYNVYDCHASIVKAFEYGFRFLTRRHTSTIVDSFKWGTKFHDSTHTALDENELYVLGEIEAATTAFVPVAGLHSTEANRPRSMSIWDWLKQSQEPHFVKITHRWVWDSVAEDYNGNVSWMYLFESSFTHTTDLIHRGKERNWDEAAEVDTAVNVHFTASKSKDVSEMRQDIADGTLADSEAQFSLYFNNVRPVPEDLGETSPVEGNYGFAEGHLMYKVGSELLPVFETVEVELGGGAATWNFTETYADGFAAVDSTRVAASSTKDYRAKVLDLQARGFLPYAITALWLETFGSASQFKYEMDLQLSEDVTPLCVGDVYPVGVPHSMYAGKVSTEGVMTSFELDIDTNVMKCKFITRAL